MTDTLSLLGDEAEYLLEHTCKGLPKAQIHQPGPDFVSRVDRRQRSRARHDAGDAADLRRGAPRRHWLRLDAAGRSGHRALGRRVLRPEPDLLRPGQHRRARDRGRLQLRGLDPRRARLGLPPVRAPHPVHGQAQSQRDADAAGDVRADAVRPGRAVLRSRRARRRSDDLLRLGGFPPPDHRDLRGLPPRPPARHGHRPLGLPPEPLVQEGRQGLPRLGRPDRSGEPHRVHHPGRHRQAEAGREQRRLHGRRRSATPTTRCTRT